MKMPSDEDQPALAEVGPPTKSQQAADAARATFPIFQAKGQEKKVEDGTAREVKSGVPPLEEGDDDPDQDRTTYVLLMERAFQSATMPGSITSAATTTSDTVTRCMSL